jgi:tRNA-dihydrouridine synthase B
MQIGSYQLPGKVILAPMAGITDLPFRKLCRRFGAALTVSEMVSVNPVLRDSTLTRQRTEHDEDDGFSSVQILGTEPELMAEAAVYNVEQGAKIIDINMGCPAKKVCSKAAGSALLRDAEQVKKILDAVVGAVSVPVTLKIRTGWDKDNRNAVDIARIAEQSGIRALTVHGRTRACKFEGQAEYGTIKQVKEAVAIPVIANGDIDSPEKARFVLDYTGADAVMIGRAAQGTPWIIAQTNQYLAEGSFMSLPKKTAIFDIVLDHLEQLYGFYGDTQGVKIARKHIVWYGRHLGPIAPELKGKINQAFTAKQQIMAVKAILPCLSEGVV